MSGPGCRPSSRNIRAASPAELPVGPGEHRADAGGGVAGVQGVQAAGGSRSSAASAASGKPGRAAARAAATASASGRRAHKLAISVDRAGLGGGPGGAEPGGQQLRGLGVGEDVEGEQPGAVGGGQAGQLAAAGDQHQAARAGRQQRPDLLLVAGVVQHDQHPPAASRLRYRPACASGLAGMRSGGTPRASRNPRIASAGGDRGAGRVEAAQVHIQLPVGEPAARPGAPSAGPARSCPPRRSRRSREHHRPRPAGPAASSIRVSAAARRPGR